MHTPEEIYICGDYAGDFILYFAYIINNMGYRVAVIDRTSGIGEYFTGGEGIEYVSVKNIDYYTGTPDRRMVYDYLLIYDGIEYYEENFKRNILIITDINRRYIQNIAGYKFPHKNRSMLVIRNTLGKGITRKYLSNIVCFDNIAECVADIQYNSTDNEYMYRLQYERIKSIRHISDKMEKCLMTAVCYFTGKTPAIVAKAVRHTREGKIIEHSILG